MLTSISANRAASFSKRSCLLITFLTLAANSENKINLPSFTPREASVLQLVAEGLMNKEIARRLETSIRNVEKYVSRLFIRQVRLAEPN